MNHQRERAYEAEQILQQIVDQPLCYGLKSPDTELYDLGFGARITQGNARDMQSPLPPFFVHALCEIAIIRRKEKQTNLYDSNVSSQTFLVAIEPLIGQVVHRVCLGADNDLWIDLGDNWLVFRTNLDNKESWRFFGLTNESPYLIAANNWLSIEGTGQGDEHTSVLL